MCVPKARSVEILRILEGGEINVYSGVFGYCHDHRNYRPVIVVKSWLSGLLAPSQYFWTLMRIEKKCSSNCEVFSLYADAPFRMAIAIQCISPMLIIPRYINPISFEHMLLPKKRYPLFRQLKTALSHKSDVLEFILNLLPNFHRWV